MENNTGRTDGITGTQAGLPGDAQPASIRENATRGAQNLIDRAEQQARSKINATQKDVGLTLSSVASTLMSSSTQLRDEQQNAAGEYVGKAAEQIDRLARYIQNADPNEVADNVRNFARQRPAVFIGAAFALGVIGARFLKSSRRDVRYDDRSGSPGLTDREVPTLRSVEGAGAGAANLTSAGLYGDGGLSASSGMPASVPTDGPHTGIAGTSITGGTTGETPGVTGRGSSGDLS